MEREANKLIQSLSSFYKNKEKSWSTAIPSGEAKEKCKDIWASLAHVKDTRKSAAEALTAKLNDALGEAEKAICEEAAARRQAEDVLSNMVSSLKEKTREDLKQIRRKREQTEEKILRLLEESC
ncbi:hypothetical protein, conserved [Eimeria praecox]|uniref:Uncharacterized protein n=1 Tax=Eimeria praecox TaxID=51316 RepID=U6GE19_9EIME|nr:hypothetical protein, conserved [Eimeria praecox]